MPAMPGLHTISSGCGAERAESVAWQPPPGNDIPHARRRAGAYITRRHLRDSPYAADLRRQEPQTARELYSFYNSR